MTKRLIPLSRYVKREKICSFYFRSSWKFISNLKLQQMQIRAKISPKICVENNFKAPQCNRLVATFQFIEYLCSAPADSS